MVRDLIYCSPSTVWSASFSAFFNHEQTQRALFADIPHKQPRTRQAWLGMAKAENNAWPQHTSRWEHSSITQVGCSHTTRGGTSAILHYCHVNRHRGHFVQTHVKSRISIVAKHKRDCNLYDTSSHARTHLQRSKRPNWAWVSCVRQETDGLLGEKEAERRHAKESQWEMFPCPLYCRHVSLHHPFILVWKGKGGQRPWWRSGAGSAGSGVHIKEARFPERIFLKMAPLYWAKLAPAGWVM